VMASAIIPRLLMQSAAFLSTEVWFGVYTNAYPLGSFWINGYGGADD
jgi:hypothetical protein